MISEDEVGLTMGCELKYYQKSIGILHSVPMDAEILHSVLKLK